MASADCACWKISALFLLGVAFAVLGYLSIGFLDDVVHEKVSQEMPLRAPPENSTTPSVAYEFWKDIPVPMFIYFRFFEVENPLEITTLGEKPYLVEKGPYVYSEQRHKKDIIFGENGTVVSFREESVFHFVPEMSAGGEDDQIRLLNVPFLTVLNGAKDQGWLARQALKLAIATTGTKLFETKPVREWLWGYDDPLLEFLKTTNPELVPFTFFGWFMNRNNSDPGGLTVKTGLGDLNHEAEIVSWKNMTSIDVWTDSYCNAINGTDGTMFHPFIEKNETLYMFTNDICRSIYAQYEQDVTVKGLQALKFVPPDSVFANETENPDNACFCVPDTGHCLGAGVLNISKCQFGAPVVSSSPHLFQADPKYLARLQGLNPSKELHQTYLHIEPITGMVLQAAKRLQVNAFVDNIPTWSSYFEKFPDKIIFPVIWIEEKGGLDDRTAAIMRGQVTDQLHLAFAIQVTLFVFGGFWVCAALLLVIHKIRLRSLRKGQHTPDLVPVEVTSTPAVTHLAFDNPMDWHSPLHDDRRHPVASYGDLDDGARADTNAPVPEEGAGEGKDQGEHSINSKPGLPDWLAKIS